ncbi:MAG: hypothetical protein KJO75_10965 [Dactylosporangium sp.]|nr:hypothetical protein [Dactylosporangium sp.]
MNPTAVHRVLSRAWPGVRIEQTTPPRSSGVRKTAGLALRPSRPPVLPLLDDPGPVRWRERPDPADDRLRAVYDGLAAAGRTGGGLLQVIVGRAPAHRVSALHRVSVNPRRPRQRRGPTRALGLLSAGLRGILLIAADIITPGPGRHAPHGHHHDPYLTDLARQARAKVADAPHLLVAVHALATGPTTAAARAAVADITSGYGLISAHLVRRRLRNARRFPTSVVEDQQRAMSIATRCGVTCVCAIDLYWLTASPVFASMTANGSQDF